MIYFFWSTPPHTFGEFRPASLATSTNTTGEAAGGLETSGFEAWGFGAGTASRSQERFHFQRGLVSASSNALPRRTEEEPRKRRRRGFIIYGFSNPKLAWAQKWERAGSFARFTAYRLFIGPPPSALSLETNAAQSQCLPLRR